MFCTSIDLGWVRDTIADRSLIIKLDPRIKDGTSSPTKNFKDEAMLLRDALMTEVLGRCRNILIAQQEQAAYEAPEYLRLHDLSGFLMRCAVHEGWAPWGIDLLRGLAGVQIEEADTNNPLHDVIRYYLGSQTEIVKQPLHTSALAKRFQDAAERARIDAGFEWGRFGMSGTIAKQFSTLESKFGLRRQKDKNTKTFRYWFTPSPEVLAQCIDYAKQVNPYTYHSPMDMESL